jgi:uncharacterized membrane protein
MAIYVDGLFLYGTILVNSLYRLFVSLVGFTLVGFVVHVLEDFLTRLSNWVMFGLTLNGRT